MNGRDLFTSHFGTIRELIRAISRNGRLAGDDGEDFSSYVMLKLIENDYARLRKFKGASSLRTYLTVVIQRLLLDYRSSRLGRWRPSAGARRLGAVAVQLEELLSRDGYSFQEAVHALRWNLGVSLDREGLWHLAARLPQRRAGRFVSFESAGEPAGPARSEADDLEERELSARVEAAMSRGMDSLSETDRLTLELRFERGLTAEEIGARLDLPPKVVYRRVGRSLKQLRKRLEGSGLQASQVRHVLASSWREISVLGRRRGASAPADV